MSVNLFLTDGDSALVELKLYSTLGCHLCEEAEALLNQAQTVTDVGWQTVEIAESDKLMQEYGLRIPVVQYTENGAELGWPFDEHRLMDWLVVQKGA